MGDTIESLKRLFRIKGIPVFGIAESRVLENEPKGYRPSDILPTASSMLCFGIPVPKGIMLNKKKINMNYWRLANIYYHNIDVISSQAAIIIENGNQIATPVLS